jgi:hypothetical protein
MAVGVLEVERVEVMRVFTCQNARATIAAFCLRTTNRIVAVTTTATECEFQVESRDFDTAAADLEYKCTSPSHNLDNRSPSRRCRQHQRQALSGNASALRAAPAFPLVPQLPSVHPAERHSGNRSSNSPAPRTIHSRSSNHNSQNCRI